MRTTLVYGAALLSTGLLVACEASPKPAPAAAADSVPAAVSARPSADTAAYPAWSRSATIYEVNLRQYTPEGSFAAFEKHLPRLKRLGIDILWLMPVQPIGKVGRKGSLGSYYAISDYTAVNPEHGTEADFKHLVDAAHALGMKVILDWVANHTAKDHEWITAHPDFHERRADGTVRNARDNEGKETDWTDVAELDYSNKAMRLAMIGEMRWWLDTMGIDGFRCDVAGGAPTDFWVEARSALRSSSPDLFMLAEAESPQIHAAFDMTYGWELHHLLNDLATGKQRTSALEQYFARQDSAYGPGAYRMYFTSNHDENSWSGTEFERMGANHLPAFVLAATVENSMPLLYTGQEASLRKRLRFFDKDTVDWSGPSLEPFYSSIFSLKHSAAPLGNGPWGARQVTLRTTGGDRVFAFTRTKGASAVLVAVNFGDGAVNAAYQGLASTGAFTDWFSKATVSLATTGSLLVPAHGYRVLVR